MLTTQQKIEAIREACIRCNPEIVELKFGCITEKGIIVGAHWSAFLNEYEYVLRPYHVDRLPERLVVDCLGEIIGRPIRLSDVLLAIKEKDVAIEKQISEATGHDGCKSAIFYHFMQAWMARESRIGEPCFWTLRADDLTLQKPATIEFIYSVLKK